jgi:hypothetical protein
VDQSGLSVRRDENIEAAEAVLLKGRRLHPKSALIAFNLACYASVVGHIEEAKARLQQAVDLGKTFGVWPSMTKISELCGTGSLGFLDSKGNRSPIRSRVLPLAKVAAETQFLRDLETRNYAAFDTPTGLPRRLRCSSIFSAGLVEMGSEAVPFGENRLQKGMEPFRAGDRFLQLREKRAGIHIS